MALTKVLTGGIALDAVDNTILKLDDDYALTGTVTGAGGVVQVKNVQTGSDATDSTAIPFNNTIPQITEGHEYMTLAITPTSATNKLRIEVLVQGAAVSSDATIALFVGTTANALNTGSFFAGNNERQQWVINHYMDAGSTSELTFRVRAGGSAANAFYFNRSSGGAHFGGTFISSITITEIAV